MIRALFFLFLLFSFVEGRSADDLTLEDLVHIQSRVFDKKSEQNLRFYAEQISAIHDDFLQKFYRTLLDEGRIEELITSGKVFTMSGNLRGRLPAGYPRTGPLLTTFRLMKQDLETLKGNPLVKTIHIDELSPAELNVTIVHLRDEVVPAATQVALESFNSQIRDLEKRAAFTNSTEYQRTAASLMAKFYVHINSIRPFDKGSEPTARVLLKWAAQRLRVPIPELVPSMNYGLSEELFATKLFEAMETTRANFRFLDQHGFQIKFPPHVCSV